MTFELFLQVLIDQLLAKCQAHQIQAINQSSLDQRVKLKVKTSPKDEPEDDLRLAENDLLAGELKEVLLAVSCAFFSENSQKILIEFDFHIKQWSTGHLNLHGKVLGVWKSQLVIALKIKLRHEVRLLISKKV